MQQRARLRAACLTVGLCTAWGAGAPAQAAVALFDSVAGDIDTGASGVSLANTYFLYGYNSSGVFTDVRSLGALAPGSTAYSVSGILQDCGVFLDCRYTVVAQYDNAGATGVSVATTNGVAGDAIGAGFDFASVFPEPFGPGSGVTEAELDTALGAGDTSTLQAFFEDNFFSFELIGAGSTLLNFSAASNGGTVTAGYAVVPLAPALVLFAPVLGLLAVARRKPRKGA